ncbi:hypothetical protein A8G01_02720 [Acholeplasma laidlawii]|nr:hypothetical protein A8G01_02720 [Acholeplasma laidlawii]
MYEENFFVINATPVIIYLKPIQRQKNTKIIFLLYKRQKDNATKYVQVTLSMPTNSTRQTDNLLVVKDNYERIIVTYDYKDVGVIDGIKIVHLTTFLDGSFE